MRVIPHLASEAMQRERGDKNEGESGSLEPLQNRPKALTQKLFLIGKWSRPM